MYLIATLHRVIYLQLAFACGYTHIMFEILVDGFYGQLTHEQDYETEYYFCFQIIKN